MFSIWALEGRKKKKTLFNTFCCKARVEWRKGVCDKKQMKTLSF